MTIKEIVWLIVCIFGFFVFVSGFIYFLRTDKKRVQKLKKKIYYEYSYDDFRQMLVKVHMRAVANKDKEKEKKTLDSLVQLDEIYDFLSSELNLKDWRDIYNKYL